MKKVFKIVRIFIFVTILCVGFVGCSSKEEKNASIETKDVEHVNVKSEGHYVVVSESTSDKIEISLTGYEGELFKKEGGTITIKAPMSDSIINFGAKDIINIGIPKNSITSLSIISEAGDIKLDSVQIKEVNATAEYGNIIAMNLSGMVNATTEIGKIKGKSATLTKDGIGQIYEGKVGNENTDQVITLISKTADIEIE